MAKASLASMSVDALLKLSEDINTVLNRVPLPLLGRADEIIE